MGARPVGPREPPALVLQSAGDQPQTTGSEARGASLSEPQRHCCALQPRRRFVMIAQRVLRTGLWRSGPRNCGLTGPGITACGAAEHGMEVGNLSTREPWNTRGPARRRQGVGQTVESWGHRLRPQGRGASASGTRGTRARDGLSSHSGAMGTSGSRLGDPAVACSVEGP